LIQKQNGKPKQQNRVINRIETPYPEDLHRKHASLALECYNKIQQIIY